ncbi:IS1380 family transposase [Actinocrinis puniceicyclus]|uniref:IS1380 family transposase n=1 Tax=Actinocrinis puniceicyclus TaxID=977794 RepID=A0A8J7WWZ5_9ACTN|nr:IS1380 family transposase [Actinocrinis puniceicyclus]MBS2966634.1 IS1380 family transposase [Actinocrinis puniceicyclus]
MKKRNGWDRGLKVDASGKGLVGHAGAVLLHRTADRVGLPAGLRGALTASPWMLDRANALVSLIVGIALGARSVRQAELLARHHTALLGAGASDSTLWRALGEIDDQARLRIAKARARVRERVWDLLAGREEGFPWLVILGKRLTGWVVIDLDATIITASSKKQGAAGTYKGSYGFHPLAAWCANTFEALAMMLRPGNAGSNTVADHLAVIADALAQVPRAHRGRILIRLDGAGASHGLIEHLLGLGTRRRTVAFTSGFTITETEEQAIAQLPESAWDHAFEQDGRIDPHAQVAELTGLWLRTGWPEELRYLVRRVKASRRHEKKLTNFEKETGWRYQITVTNIRDLGRAVPGSHHVFFLDALHRQHAVVEDRVRTEKATGIRNLPLRGYARNQAWLLAANIASDLLAYLQLLGLHHDGDLARAEPQTLRATILHIPARLVHHARQRVLKIEATWPWAQAFQTCWTTLGALPDTC